jgi:hypothetical protein
MSSSSLDLYEPSIETMSREEYEMPSQEGDEGSQVHHHEEWEACNSGCMPHLWHKDVQNWEGITLIAI